MLIASLLKSWKSVVGVVVLGVLDFLLLIALLQVAGTSDPAISAGVGSNARFGWRGIDGFSGDVSLSQSEVYGRTKDCLSLDLAT